MSGLNDPVAVARAEVEAAENAERTEVSSDWERPAEVTDTGRVFSLRIPASRLAELRQVAERRGMKPTVLMREWVLERLAAENAEEPDDPWTLHPGELHEPWHLLLGIDQGVSRVSPRMVDDWRNHVPVRVLVGASASEQQHTFHVDQDAADELAAALEATEDATAKLLANVRATAEGEAGAFRPAAADVDSAVESTTAAIHSSFSMIQYRA